MGIKIFIQSGSVSLLKVVSPEFNPNKISDLTYQGWDTCYSMQGTISYRTSNLLLGHPINLISSEYNMILYTDL